MRPALPARDPQPRERLAAAGSDVLTVVIVRNKVLNLDVSFAAGQSKREQLAVAAARP
jgi:hypothetical protein